MTRRNIPFLIYLLVLSAIAGWLIHRMSWIGRVGINLAHKEYKFLKVWYQAGAAVFVTLLILYILQHFATRRLSRSSSNLVNGVALLLALGGLYMTYSDFHSDFTHSILKERFHLGAYLFWIGWISISLYLFATRQKQLRDSEQQIVGPQQGPEIR